MKSYYKANEQEFHGQMMSDLKPYIWCCTFILQLLERLRELWLVSESSAAQ